MLAEAPSQPLHASAVAMGSRGLLILGGSGAGKSSLALELIGLGASLVADDGVRVDTTPDGRLRLSPPAAIAGRIEARGVGLIALPYRSAHAFAAVTLDQVETERLPPLRSTSIKGVELPLLYKVESPAFPAILAAYLTGERTDP